MFHTQRFEKGVPQQAEDGAHKPRFPADFIRHFGNHDKLTPGAHCTHWTLSQNVSGKLLPHRLRCRICAKWCAEKTTIFTSEFANNKFYNQNWFLNQHLRLATNCKRTVQNIKMWLVKKFLSIRMRTKRSIVVPAESTFASRRKLAKHIGGRPQLMIGVI